MVKKLGGDDKISGGDVICNVLIEIVSIILAIVAVLTLSLLASMIVGELFLPSDGDDLGSGVVIMMIFTAILIFISAFIFHIKRFFSFLINQLFRRS